MYTGASSFQSVGIEEFHCIQWCPHFRGVVPLYTEASLFQGVIRVLLIEVSSFQGVRIEEFHCI